MWSNKQQWNTGTLPGRADDVVINAGKTLTADTDATVNSILAPNVSGHTATLNVSEDIKLEANIIYIGRGAYAGATSVMNHFTGTVDAGTLYVAAGEGSTSTCNLSDGAVLPGVTLDVGQVGDARSTGSAMFNRSGGTVSSSTIQIAGKGDASYILSGGKIDTTDLLLESRASPADSILEISTDAASVAIASDMIVGSRAKLVFKLSAGGATTIKVTDRFKITSKSAQLIIDASGYTGGASNIDLVTFSSMNGQFASPVIKNPDPCLTGKIKCDSDRMYLNIISAD